jgi:hypothetical protein
MAEINQYSLGAIVRLKPNAAPGSIILPGRYPQQPAQPHNQPRLLTIASLPSLVPASASDLLARALVSISAGQSLTSALVILPHSLALVSALALVAIALLILVAIVVRFGATSEQAALACWFGLALVSAVLSAATGV